MKKIVSLLLVFLIAFSNVYANPEDSTFLKLVDVNDEFIVKMLMGGATAEELELFINDMDEFVAGFQENIIMQDIDSFFITILLQTIQKEEHFNVLIAFDAMFQEEMVYMLNMKKVPDSMAYFKIILFGDKVTVIIPPDNEDEPLPPPLPEINDEEPEELPEPVLPPEPEIVSPFSDVSVDAPYINALLELTESNVISGKTDGLFHPNDYIKREEALKILIEALMNKDALSYDEYANSGEEKLWFVDYLKISRYYSLISGIYDEKYFEPNKYISRQDFVSIAYRTSIRADLVLPFIYPATDFLDINEFRFYAVEPIERMLRAGIIKGVGDNKFAPEQSVTRSEAVQIIYDIIHIGK